VGGRITGVISLRMGPYDFKPKARDGLGLDWPFEYKDIEPWYDKTEALVGVYGDNHGLENTPDSPNNISSPGSAATAAAGGHDAYRAFWISSTSYPSGASKNAISEPLPVLVGPSLSG